ncbi:hypothetical protein B0O99DRAFT_109095 [Bisporella sp. PMI_857]|nr:hypothetical protein B0O99DRAFT_109095 [Bisporella sp. PMI_857]
MSNEAKEVILALDGLTRVLNTVSKLMRSEDIENQAAYCLEISKAKDAVELIRNQKVLQTKDVVAGVQILQGHGDILKSNLLSRHDDDEDDRELKKILEVFTSRRKSLVEQIRLANPGLSKTSKPITVDARVVKNTDEAVKKALGKRSGLFIALFLEELNRDPDTKGKITLTSKEYGELATYYTSTALPPSKPLNPGVKSRSFFNCFAKGHSIQILGPVEKDLWADVDSVKTEGLISTENALQFGYAVTLGVFREAVNVQDKRIAADRKITKEFRH